MKRMQQWMSTCHRACSRSIAVLAATFICGSGLFTSCAESDNPVSPPAPQGKLVTLPPGVVSKGYTMQSKKVSRTSIGDRVFYDKQNVQIAFDGNDVYVTGFSPSFPESFVKGTLTAAGTCLFKSGQCVGEDEEGDKYVIGMKAVGDKEYEVTDFECSYDPEMKMLILPADDGKCDIAESDDPLTPHLTPLAPIIQSVTVMPGAFKEHPLVKLPEGLTTEQWYITGSDKSDYSLNYGVTVGFDGQDVYIQGLFKQLPLTWVHGRLADGVITVEKGQFLGYYKQWMEVFLVGGKGEEVGDLTLTYDAEKGIMESDNTVAMYAPDTQEYQYAFFDPYITKERYVVPDPVLPPAGMSASAYRIECEEISWDEDKGSWEKDDDGIDEVLVCFDGNDAYLKLPYVNASGWVKGTLSADGRTITIPALTYFGSWQAEGPREDYYLTGLVEKDNGKVELTDIVIDCDAQHDILKSSQTMCINSSYRTYSPYGFCTYRNMVFTKKKEVAATPAAPEVELSNNDAESYLRLTLTISLFADDGADLLTDKLSYVIYYEKDGQQHELVFRAADNKGLENDIVEIPYNLRINSITRAGTNIELDKTLDGLFTWTKVGAKVIYRGGGEEHASPITWFDARKLYEEEGLLK